MNDATLPHFDTWLPAGDDGTLALQRCGECAEVSYPPRELCGACLADALEWAPVDTAGRLLATIDVHHSLEPYYAARLPWRVGSVQLACGPTVIAHLAPEIDAPGTTVQVVTVTDPAGNRVLVAAGADRDLGGAAAIARLLADTRLESAS